MSLHSGERRPCQRVRDVRNLCSNPLQFGVGSQPAGLTLAKPDSKQRYGSLTKVGSGPKRFQTLRDLSGRGGTNCGKGRDSQVRSGTARPGSMGWTVNEAWPATRNVTGRPASTRAALLTPCSLSRAREGREPAARASGRAGAALQGGKSCSVGAQRRESPVSLRHQRGKTHLVL